ncbi:hypothetical protein [Roseivivax marinus]|uniref:hypothetical protein n=1 Tax=Roseivivax marinus TaxID=1379903 RepID=UPI00273DA544|nr:hypothetical protein [Roseivivax marinus]
MLAIAMLQTDLEINVSNRCWEITHIRYEEVESVLVKTIDLNYQLRARRFRNPTEIQGYKRYDQREQGYDKRSGVNQHTHPINRFALARSAMSTDFGILGNLPRASMALLSHQILTSFAKKISRSPSSLRNEALNKLLKECRACKTRFVSQAYFGYDSSECWLSALCVRSLSAHSVECGGMSVSMFGQARGERQKGPLIGRL